MPERLRSCFALIPVPIVSNIIKSMELKRAPNIALDSIPHALKPIRSETGPSLQVNQDCDQIFDQLCDRLKYERVPFEATRYSLIYADGKDVSKTSQTNRPSPDPNKTPFFACKMSLGTSGESSIKEWASPLPKPKTFSTPASEAPFEQSTASGSRTDNFTQEFALRSSKRTFAIRLSLYLRAN
jgi:hypothetical protein